MVETSKTDWYKINNITKVIVWTILQKYIETNRQLEFVKLAFNIMFLKQIHPIVGHLFFKIQQLKTVLQDSLNQAKPVCYLGRSKKHNTRGRGWDVLNMISCVYIQGRSKHIWGPGRKEKKGPSKTNIIKILKKYHLFFTIDMFN